MTTDTQHFKSLLESERSRIEGELSANAERATAGTENWQAVQPEKDEDAADREDVAEAIESYENNESIVASLKTELNEIDRALEKIAAGTYGTCEVGGEEIEEDRLKANPAARTCKTHIGDL